MVSGYRSELYDELLVDWYRYEIPTSTQQGSGHGQRVEVVWSNRPLNWEIRYRTALVLRKFNDGRDA